MGLKKSNLNNCPKQKIVTIGGGTGSFVLLSGLKNYPVDLTAIVSMADDGGSTGILRDELGVLPPGDVRQCLVALSESSQMMRDLFNYRYNNGGLGGHNFGNIFLSTLEKITGSLNQGIKEAGRVLRIRGKVVPVTLTKVRLEATLRNGKKIIGQSRIFKEDLTGLKKLELRPKAVINPAAIKAIREADKIIITPGALYSSIIPNFLVKGFIKEVARAKAKKIYVCNLMTKIGHTDNFTVLDFLAKIESYLGKGVIKYVIYNKAKPESRLLRKYASEGELVSSRGLVRARPGIKFIGRNIISHKFPQQKKGDLIRRTLIRHDSDKIAKIIFNL